MRTVSLHPRQQPQRSGIRAAIRCAIPQAHRWAGAATPTQQNITQAHEHARRASDAINASNFTSKDNSPPGLGDPVRLTRRAQPTRPREPARGATEPASPARSGRIPAVAGLVLVIVGRVVLSRLAAIPHRLGDRLFSMNDTEAYWRGWQITRTQAGLGRSYRDPQFGTLAECPKCRGAGVTAGGVRHHWPFG